MNIFGFDVFSKVVNGGGSWGSITGNLSDQADLQSELDNKVSADYWDLAILADGATITPDLSVAKNFEVVLGGNRTLGVPSNMSAGQQGFITVWQDSTGNRTLSFGWCYEFQGGAVPLISPLKGIKSQLYYCVNNYKKATVTNTIGTDTFTAVANGLKYGSKIRFETTDSLPDGISVDTDYWVNPIGPDTFTIASSYANLALGAYISTSGSQSGVHSFVEASVTISVNPAVRRD